MDAGPATILVIEDDHDLMRLISASQVGCDSFVAKPFDADRLLKEVAKYVPVPGCHHKDH